MNNVVLIGRIVKKPEIRYSPNTQEAVTSFTIAVDRYKEGADFIKVTAYGKRAESICRYMDKGRQIAIQGRIRTGSYKDKDGKTVYTTEVIIDNDEFLGGRSEAPVETTPARVPDIDYDETAFVSANDDIPF